MSQTKREQVISHLRYLREELREMHLSIKNDGLYPEPGELRGLMAQMDALLDLINGKTKIDSNIDAAQLHNRNGFQASKNKFSDKDCRKSSNTELMGK